MGEYQQHELEGEGGAQVIRLFEGLRQPPLWSTAVDRREDNEDNKDRGGRRVPPPQFREDVSHSKQTSDLCQG